MRRLMIITLLTFLIALGCGITAFAASDEQSVTEPENGLSLEEVIEQALIKSTALKQAEKDVDRAWEARDAARAGNIASLKRLNQNDDISTGVLYTSTFGGDEDGYFRFLSANGQWSINKKMLDLTEDATVLQAKGNYHDVIKKQHKLEITEVSLQKAEDDFRIATAKSRVGMATNLEVQAANSLLEAEKSALEQAQAELENAYRNFNKLIGLKPEERPNLITPIEFEKLDVPSLENVVSVVLSSDNNPYLWTKKEGYEISKYTWTFSESRAAGLIDKEKASLTYQEAREDTRNKVYELYDTLKTLEAAYESALMGLTAAEESLRVTQAMYEAGLVTKNDVLDKEVALNRAQDGLLNVKSSYALTTETFEHPWLAFVGGSGASF